MNQRVPRILDHRYELGEVIGSGGMATVYAAEDTRLGRPVALKVLRPEHAAHPTLRVRFQREAESVASLNHPSIVSVYDTGSFEPVGEDYDDDATVPMPALPEGGGLPEEPGAPSPAGSGTVQVPFIVMERLQGRTLKTVLEDSEGPLPLEDALSYTHDILDALSYSHEHGIVHRDIKPANVMVLDRTEEEESTHRPNRIKVMDFGIARAIAESGAPLTEAHTIMGTARYIAPEQARGETVDARTDLYSVGCLLYLMLTGRAPFEGATSLEVAEKHLSEQPVPPSQYREEISPALDSVVLTALAKNRQDRFQSAQDFEYSLDNADHGISVASPEDLDPLGQTIPAAGLGAAAGGAAGIAALNGLDRGQGGEANESSMSQPETGGFYTTHTGSVPQTEDATVEGFFPDSAQDEYSDEELYESERNLALAARRRRRNAWKNTILALIIILLAATAAGAWLYYTHELNKPVYVSVPDVEDRSQQEAEQELRNEGFRVSVTEEFDDDVPEGDVIGTDPRAFTQLEKDSTVTLIVSRGPAELTIPEDLAGQSEAYVRDRLSSMGLEAGGVTSVNHPTLPAGMVIGTDPEVGSTVPSGARVNLILSNGKVQVPQLVGLTRDEAIAALTDSDVLLNTAIETEDSSQPAGTVIRQSANAGSSVEQGSTVTITVSSGPRESGRTSQAPRPSSSPTQSNDSGNQDQGDDEDEEPEQDRSPAGDASPTPSPSGGR